MHFTMAVCHVQSEFQMVIGPITNQITLHNFSGLNFYETLIQPLNINIAFLILYSFWQKYNNFFIKNV